VVQWAGAGGLNQMWEVIDLGSGLRRLRPTHAEMSLAVPESSKEPGASIQIWTPTSRRPSTGALSRQATACSRSVRRQVGFSWRSAMPAGTTRRLSFKRPTRAHLRRSGALSALATWLATGNTARWIRRNLRVRLR
jgi:hypothetical protein